MQLCIFHIASNVMKMTKERWIGEGGIMRLRPEDLIDEDNTSAAAPPTDSHTQGDFVTAWKAVMYAKTPEDCEARWDDLSREFHKQKLLLEYLCTTYLPLRRQRARAYTRHYRNYGHYTTSPCEALHSSAKSLLRNASSNLYQLFKALTLQYHLIETKFYERVNHEARRIRDEFRHQLLFEITDHISWKGLGLVHKQYLRDKGAKLCPDKYGIGACTGGFQSQYGLPCCHLIHDEYLEIEGTGSDRKVATTRSLELSLFDNQWMLRRDLDQIDPYRRIRDPRVIARRREPQNVALPKPPLPTQPATQPATQSRVSTPARASRVRSQRRQHPSNMEVFSEALRGMVRAELARTQSQTDVVPPTPPQAHTVIQQPALSHRDSRFRTIPRSQVSQRDGEDSL